MPLKGGPGNRVVYEAGPEQPSTASLARWLAQKAGEKPMKVWLEIPVRLELSGQPLQPIESVTLGFGKSLPFALELDDTMMGIPLLSRLQEFCPKLKELFGLDAGALGHHPSTHDVTRPGVYRPTGVAGQGPRRIRKLGLSW